MLSRAQPRRRDERGSVAIAATVMGVISLVLMATLQATFSSLTIARADQERTNAFHFASAGIDQALYRIDRNDRTASGAYTEVEDPLVPGRLIGFRDRITSGGSSVDIIANKTPSAQDRKWTVRATGRDSSGRRRQAITSIEARSLVTDGFFTLKDFYLTGNQTTPKAYSSDTCPTAVACELPAPIAGSLGTNGQIVGPPATIEHFAKSWSAFNMYGRATAEAADRDCGSYRCDDHGAAVNAITDRRVVEIPDLPAGVQSCPGGGSISGPITLAPGDYLCDGPLNISGAVTIGGAATSVVRIWSRNSLSFSPNAIVNAGTPTWRFQVFQTTRPDGTAWSGSICGAQVWGVLYTPGLSIDCPGAHQPKIWGSVVAQMYSGTGNQFEFHWDLTAIDRVHNNRFVVRNWRECPPTASDC